MHAAQIEAWVNAMPMAALFIAKDQSISALNDHAISVIGQGFTGRSYISALRYPAALNAISSCFADQQEQSCTFQSSDGDTATTFDLRCAYVKAGANGVLVTLTDLTAIEKTSQLHSDFVANVSHELRTPLTAISGFIETLQGPAKADEKAQTLFLGMMATETTRMDRLVGDLLSLSRVEAQARERPKSEVHVADILTSIAQQYNVLGRAKNASIKLDLQGKDALVLGDRDQLYQVFSNLVDNATKYGGDGVQIAMNLNEPTYDKRLRKPAIRITVSDTGNGIDPIHIPRLTERFYRIDDHRSREMGGTGLGLAIVKHIVTRHRGRLEIKSTLSQGSDFTVILPLKETT